MHNSCNLCNRHVHSHSYHLKCSLCHKLTHLKCLPLVSHTDTLYTQRHNDNWFCAKCLQSVFPFNHYHDDDDFNEAIKECQSYHNMKAINVSDRVFNVFDYNDENVNNPLLDIDPTTIITTIVLCKVTTIQQIMFVVNVRFELKSMKYLVVA